MCPSRSVGALWEHSPAKSLSGENSSYLYSRSKGLPPIPVTNEGNVARVSGISWDVQKLMVAFWTWDLAVAVTALQYLFLICVC